MSASSSATLRRSARLQASGSIHSAHTDREAPPPNKRRRTSTSTAGSSTSASARGKRKSLDRLPDMPLDILFEIFAHLKPHDLLHLSRTTKALRRVLMSRSSITVWRRARKHCPDLPECPPSMTEPAYADLLFDPHCHFCVTARVIRGMWANQVRCCKRCLKEHFAEGIFRLPDFTLPKTGYVVPQDIIDDKFYYSRSEAEKLREKVAQCNGDASALKALRSEQLKFTRNRQEFKFKLMEWQSIEGGRRREEKRTLRLRRGMQIVNRLNELGYQLMLSEPMITKFITHPLVQQSKELTDRIWNNIKASMIEFAEEARTDARMRERCAHYMTRLNVIRVMIDDWILQQPLWVNAPTVADLSWYSPDLRAYLDGGPLIMWTQLEDSAYRWTVDMVRKLMAMIPVEAYDNLPDAAEGSATKKGKGRKKAKRTGKGKGKEKEKAVEVVPAHQATMADNQRFLESAERTLRLPTSWFRCTVKGCIIDYPRVLSHQCAKTGPPITMDPQTDADNLNNAYNIILEEFPWNYTGDKVVYDMDAHRAGELVGRAAAMKLKFERITHMELNHANERFVCSLCSTDGMVCVMPWKIAVAHLCQPSHRKKPVKVTILNDEDKAEVLDRESRDLRDKFNRVYKIWGCVCCRNLGAMPLAKVVAHCISEHDVDEPDVVDDYDLHPDAETWPEAPAEAQYYPEDQFTTTILR